MPSIRLGRRTPTHTHALPHRWFEQTKDLVPNHILAVPHANACVGKKCVVCLCHLTPSMRGCWWDAAGNTHTHTRARARAHSSQLIPPPLTACVPVRWSLLAGACGRGAS